MVVVLSGLCTKWLYRCSRFPFQTPKHFRKFGGSLHLACCVAAIQEVDSCKLAQTVPWIQRISVYYVYYKPWKINMEPKNGGLEDDFPFELGDLSGVYIS